MKAAIKFLLSVIAIVIGSYLIGGVTVESTFVAIVVVIVLSLLNIFVTPILILLTLPITLVTLGLFLVVVNSIIFLLVDWIVPGFSIDSFWNAILLSIVYSILMSFLEWMTGKFNKRNV